MANAIVMVRVPILHCCYCIMQKKNELCGSLATCNESLHEVSVNSDLVQQAKKVCTQVA